jgi:aryl-alcohol dehydrogenase-like predicted oxidoreductase
LVFTKCGLQWDVNNPMQVAERILNPASIRRECEVSLRRLGIERIDLYQFHWPNNCGTPIEDSWGEMARLAQEGKVRAAGVSNFSVDLLERCEAVRHVDSLQPPFSLINRKAGDQEIPWCKSHNTGVICYSPMQSGLLTDNFSASRIAQMAADDWRRNAAEFLEPKLSNNLALRDSLRPIASRHACSVSSVAVAWTLSWPGVTGAIVGARTPLQVDGWIQGASLQLTPGDREEIAAAISRTQAGTGPTQPAKAATTGISGS